MPETTETQSYSNPYDDPLFLSNSDFPGMSLVTSEFTGTNYLNWSRGVLMALNSKNKAGFINGVIPKPKEDASTFAQWKRCDNMVRCWIINSMSKTLREGYLSSKSAKLLWTEITERYGQSNAPLLYQLKKDLRNVTQEGDSIIEYYNKLKRHWDDIEDLDVIFPDCSCGVMLSYSCDILKKVVEKESREKVMTFLMGLNENFDNLRGNILAMDPLPPVNKVYSLTQQIESQRKITSIVNVSQSANAMVVNRNFHNSTPAWQSPVRNVLPNNNPGGFVSNNGGSSGGFAPNNNWRKKTRVDTSRWCDVCQVYGHTRETCFVLHLDQKLKYEARFKKPIKQSNNAEVMVDTPLGIGNVDVPLNLPSVDPAFVNQLQEVYKWMNTQQQVNNSGCSVASVNVAEFRDHGFVVSGNANVCNFEALKLIQMLPLSLVGVPLEMTKRRWRELMQALYESHFDPSKDEQLKQSKIEIENKLPKTLKLVKERRQSRKNRNTEAHARKESELVELIEDFHTQYQFVYDLYDNLREQLTETVNNNKEDEGYFTATSISDSESDSEDGEEDEEIADTCLNKGHDRQYMEVMNKVQGNDRNVKMLEERSRALQEELGKREQKLSRLAKMHRFRQKEALALIKELELEISSSNFELTAICKEKLLVEVQVENKELQVLVSNLEKVTKEMDEELSALVSGDDEIEDGSISEVFRIKCLMEQVNQLRQNVNCLNAKNADFSGNDSHENLIDQVNKMKNDLGSMRKKNTDMEWKMKKKSQENSDLLSQIDSLKKELANKTQRMQNEKEDTQAKAENLKSEVHNQSSQKIETEKQLVRKDKENVELKHELERVQEKMINLEKMLKEREDQLFALQNKFNNGEDDVKPAQMVSLMSQINNIEHDLGSKNDFERQLKIKNQEIIKLTSERELLQGRVSELDNKLQDRGDEFSKLQNDMSTQIVALTRQVNQLQQETDMKRKLEDQRSYQEREIGQLVDEKENLQAKILELEITLTEKEDELASSQRRLQLGENETSARVSGLTSQISYLQGALSDERKKSLEKLTHMENQNNELASKLSNQQAILKQQEDSINKLREDSKLVKGRFLQAADRKMDEVAEEFRKTFEGKLRILSQRIRVAEQLHGEDKDSFNKIKKRCEEQHPGIERKLADLMSSSKANILKLSKAMDEMLKEMEQVVNDYESQEGSFLQRISRLSDEVHVAKNWVRCTMDEVKPWKNEQPGSPFAPMDDKEQEKLLKEKVRKLESKVNKEKGDKLRLMRGMYDLQRKITGLEKTVAEKDEGLSMLGKEKVEAIRQLCMWIEYHQSRFDHLKETMLAIKTKSRGRS